MINFKFANLASFFSKEPQNEDAHLKKDIDYSSTSSPEEKKQLLNRKEDFKASLQNLKICKSENEKQQLLKNLKFERNVKNSKDTKGYLINNKFILVFLPAFYLISSVVILLVLLVFRALNSHYYHNNFLSLSHTTNSKDSNVNAISKKKISMVKL